MAPVTDLDGDGRIFNGVVDIGADEFVDRSSAPLPLTTAVAGDGSVIPWPGTYYYSPNRQVTVFATSGSGWSFAHWQGDISVTNNPYTFVMNSAKNVQAVFLKLFDLTVATRGVGSVSPTVGTYQSNTVVQVTATPGPGAVFSHWEGDVSGSQNPLPITMTANKQFTAIFQSPLGEAVDQPGLDWRTGGNAPWRVLANVTHDGIDGTVSGSIGHNQESWMETTINGSGVVSFWWKVSAGDFFDSLEFSINGVKQNSIAKIVDWEQRTYALSAATNTLRWRYQKDFAASGGSDAGWVDEVSFDGIIRQPTNQTAAFGQAVSFSVGVMGASPFSYQWYFNGTNRLQGATNPMLNLSQAQAVHAGQYHVVVSNAVASVTSASVILMVTPPMYALSVSTNGLGTVTPGSGIYVSDTVAMATAAPAAGWRFSHWAGDYLGTNNPVSLLMDRPRSLQAIFLKEFDLTTMVSGLGSVVPGSGTFVSNDVFQLVATPATNWTFSHWGGDATGSPNPLLVTMDGSKDVQALFLKLFSLQSVTAGGGSLLHTPAGNLHASNSVVSIIPIPAAGWRFVRWDGDVSGTQNPLGVLVSDDRLVRGVFGVTWPSNHHGAVEIGLPGGGTIDHGGSVSLTALPPGGYGFLTWLGDALGARQNPVSFVVTNPTPIIGAAFVSSTIDASAVGRDIVALKGNDLRFSIKTPAATVAPVIQWLRNGFALAAETNATLSLADVQTSHEGSYTVEVTVSGITSLAVIARLAVVTTIQITEEPEDAAVLPSGFAQFEVGSLASPPPSYQWRKNGQEIAGATSRFLNIFGVQAADLGGYDVVVANGLGSVTSRVAQLSFVVAPQISENPVSQVAIVGSTATFRVVAGQGTPPLSYSWTRDNTALPNTTATLVITNVTVSDAGGYRVIVANAGGAATSQAATLTVQEPPRITGQPENLLKPAGGSARFTVGAVGQPAPGYQWYRDGIALSGSARHSGVSSPDLQIADLVLTDGAEYLVVAANPAGSATSRVAQLTVQLPPVIVVQPADRAGLIGGAMSLAPQVTGTPPLRFQWYFNSQPVPGETGPSLVRQQLLRGHQGRYGFVVSNLVGIVVSRDAYLRVRSRQSIGQLTSLAGGEFRLVFGDSGGEVMAADLSSNFVIEASGDLANWSVISTNGADVVSTNLQLQFRDRSAPGLNRRFYRVFER